MPRTNRLRACEPLLVLLALVFPSAALGQQGAAVAANVEENARRGLPMPAHVASTLNATPEGLENLLLAPGFLLQMDLYGIPEMSTQLRVDAQGNVAIPLLGVLHVGGETVSQAQTSIARTFTEREIFNDPQVNLNILQYPARAVSVMGEVQTPGRFQLLAPMSLRDVLAMAGGATIAAGNQIEIQHGGANGTAAQSSDWVARGDEASLRGTLVAPGDSVLVRRAGIVYVLGAVNRPGGYLMVNGGSLNIAQAVALAGGETAQSSTRWALITRKGGDGIEQIKVPLRKVEKGQAPAAELQQNDVLYVPQSGWKSAVIGGSSVLSAAAAASIYAASNP